MKNLKTNDAAKKKEKRKQTTINHAKGEGTGHAEDNTKTAADASVKHKNSVQDPAQSADQTLEQEQAVMNACRPAHSVAANAGNLTLAAGPPLLNGGAAAPRSGVIKGTKHQSSLKP